MSDLRHFASSRSQVLRQVRWNGSLENGGRAASRAASFRGASAASGSAATRAGGDIQTNRKRSARAAAESASVRVSGWIGDAPRCSAATGPCSHFQTYRK